MTKKPLLLLLVDTLLETHGAADPSKYVGPEPAAASIEEQGLGWKNTFGSGNGEYTIGSGLEGAWTTTPARWSHNYLENLFGFEWELTKAQLKDTNGNQRMEQVSEQRPTLTIHPKVTRQQCLPLILP